MGVGVGALESTDVIELELGVFVAEEVEDLENAGASTYSFRNVCMRLIEGDAISTTGFRLRGVTGTGELLAITDNGSGLELGGPLVGEAEATLVAGVLIGLVEGGGIRAAAFISRVFCSRKVLKKALDSLGGYTRCCGGAGGGRG